MTEVELQNFKQLAKSALLEKMRKEKHFNICLLHGLGIQYNTDPVYSVLSTLHCIDWEDMPPALRDSVFKATEELYDRYWRFDNAK